MQKYRHISIYFFSYFFNAAISFGIVSLLTHHLTTLDYGIINLYSAFIVFLTPVLSGGVLQTINVEFFKKEKKQYAQFLSDSLAIPLANTLFFTALAFIFTLPLVNFLKVDPWFVWLVPLTTFAILFNEVIASISRNRSQPALFAFFSIGRNILEGSLSVLLVIVLHQTWNGRIGALILAPVIFMIPIFFVLRKWGLLTSFSNAGNIKKILFISAPLIVERMSIFVISSSDRYFIDHYVSTSEVGLYSIGAQIAAVANLTLLSMNNFFYPYIFREIKKKEDGTGGNVKKAMFAYLGGSVVAVLGVLIATPFLFNWFIGNSFQSGRFYAIMLTCAYLPWAVYQTLLPFLLYHQRNKYIMYMAISAIVSSLILNFFLVPAIGAKGAAITLFIVNVIMAIMAYIRVRKEYPDIFK